MAQGSEFLSTPVVYSEVSGVIEKGCHLQGRLAFNGVFRINGKFAGEIYTSDTLIVGTGASVEAKVEAGVVLISGEFTGDVRARHRVEIHSPAIFKGNIETPSLKVEEGVIFEGSSRMVPSL